MKEENQQQVQQEPKEPQRVTMKDPKKVEVGKRLAAVSHKKREEQVQLERTTGWGFTSGVNKYYGIGAVIAVGVIGGLVITFIKARKEKYQIGPCRPPLLLSNHWAGPYGPHTPKLTSLI